MNTMVKKAEAAAESDTPQGVEEAAAPKGAIVIRHKDHEGKPTTRTFSADVHGKDFAKLAEEFKATNAAILLPDED
jgi:hypothetical protein